MRPTMLMLMSSSLSGDSEPPEEFCTVDTRPPGVFPAEVRRRQQRIAEVAEMIHVASLLHDDVIDTAATRRGLQALNITMGNKLAILAGDYLLARASVTLASLNEIEPVALMSQVIEHLVSGEIIQVRICHVWLVGDLRGRQPLTGKRDRRGARGSRQHGATWRPLPAGRSVQAHGPSHPSPPPRELKAKMSRLKLLTWSLLVAAAPLGAKLPEGL